MKKQTKTKLMILLSVPALLLAGCGEKAEEKSTFDSLTDTVKQTSSTIAQESKDAWEKLKDATFEDRMQVQSFYEKSASKLQGEFADLKASVSEQSGTAWNAAQDKYDVAYSKFREKLDQLGNATEENWDKLSGETEDAWNNLLNAYKDLTN